MDRKEEAGMELLEIFSKMLNVLFKTPLKFQRLGTQQIIRDTQFPTDLKFLDGLFKNKRGQKKGV